MKYPPRKLLSRIWRAAGVRVIPNRWLEHYPAATFLAKLLKVLEIDCVLDVGANRGQYRDFLRRRVRYRGHIVSFEPIPRHVESLHRRATSDPRWTIEGCALGSAPGHATFNVTADTLFSSFLRPDNSKVALFEGGNKVLQKMDIEIKVLDQVLPELERRLGVRRIYLKLDTQGYDLEVVKGAAASLHRIYGLQTEASVVPIYEGMTDYVTVIRDLESRGFVLSGIFPTNPSVFPRLVEFDCYMINQAYLPPAAE